MVDTHDRWATIVSHSRHDLGHARAETIRIAAANQLFDALVCMTAGSAEWPATVRRLASGGPATVIGTDATGDVMSAAGLNAMAAHAQDLDDLHWPSLTHQGSVVWPAVLAVAEAERQLVADVLAAGAMGCQVTTRVAAALGEKHRSTHHVTTTAGVIGVAGAVSLLRGDDNEGVVTAMAHATSVMGGSMAAVAERSRTPVVHRGYAASTGVLAGYAAGLRPSVRNALASLDLVAGPGTWEPVAPAVAQTTTRRHPVTGFAHCVIDAILDLPALDVDDVVAVQIEVPEFVLSVTHPGSPNSAAQAAWSVVHAAALALAGRLPAVRIEWPPSDETTHFADLVEVVTRPGRPPDLSVRGVIRRSTGPDLTFARRVPRGHPEDSFADADLVDKAVTRTALGQQDAMRLLESVRASTSTIDDLGLRSLRPPGEVVARTR